MKQTGEARPAPPDRPDAYPRGLEAQSRMLARRLLQGRLRYVVGAAVLAIWLLVGIFVALVTASGVVWF